MNKMKFPRVGWIACGLAVAALWISPLAAQDERVSQEQREQVRRELAEAKEQLREASRKVAELSAEIGSENLRGRHFSFSSEGRPVLGVVLAESGEPGARIAAVTPESAASEAGLRSGDRIVAIDGAAIVESDRTGLVAARGALRDLSVDREVRLSLIRDGQRIERSVRPKQSHSWSFRTGDGEEGLWMPQIVLPDIDIEIPDIDIEFDEKWADELADQVESALAAAGLEGERAAEALEQARAARLAARAERERARGERDKVRAAREAERAERIRLRMISRQGPGVHRIEMSGDESNLSLSALNQDLGRYFGIDRGVLVLASEGDDYRDLHAGDVILEVAGNKVESPRQAWRELRDGEAGTSQQVTVWRERERVNLAVTVPKHVFMPVAPVPPVPPAPPAPPSPPSPPPPPPPPVAPVAPVERGDLEVF